MQPNIHDLLATHASRDRERHDQPSQLADQLETIVSKEFDRHVNLVNAAALLFSSLRDVNWAGFYLREGDNLVLGPCRGGLACTPIPLTEGVCGRAATERKTFRVGDVTRFPGHIACDPNSRSEIVLPLLKGEELLGVLDVDSPKLYRFDTDDERMLEDFVKILVAVL